MLVLKNLIGATVVAGVCLGVSAVSSAAIVNPVYIDFGNPATGLLPGAPAPFDTDVWNVAGFSVATGAVALLDRTGAATGATVEINDSFQFYNTGGAVAGTSGDATEFWQGGNESAYIQTTGSDTGGFEITGLAPGTVYTITYFASRTGVSGDRSGQLRATGADVVTSAALNAVANVSEVVTFDVAADGTGKINFELLAGATNDSAWSYVNAIKIEVPEPGTMALLGLGTLCVVGIRRRHA